MSAKEIQFWDKWAERYFKKPIGNEEVYQKKLEITQSYFNEETEVLEFGCGTGGTALIHAPHVKHILATDLSPKMLEIAKRQAAEQNIENVTFKQSSADELEASDHSFDVVLGLSILHLLRNKEEIISKVYQMLKPGGVFASSTVCLGDKMSFFKVIGPIGRFFGLMPYLDIFKVKELEQALIEAGFELDCSWQPDGSHGVFIVARKPR